MADSNLDKPAEPASSTPAVSPDRLEDLDVSLSEAESRAVVGGGKAKLRTDNTSIVEGMSESPVKSSN